MTVAGRTIAVSTPRDRALAAEASHEPRLWRIPARITILGLCLAVAFLMSAMVAVASASPPTVTGITPAEGPTTGNTPVTITGTGFVAGASVTIGNVPATSVEVLSETEITARTPRVRRRSG